ncbi:hypothetical protein GCM10010307_59250 [Streptomyces vastus]|uniref:Uncharacterized protein n=1 Tax=Streptomyces vastus TaxID=285451 RepID=A0ABN3RDQ7_9ACTN
MRVARMLRAVPADPAPRQLIPVVPGVRMVLEAPVGPAPRPVALVVPEARVARVP